MIVTTEVQRCFQIWNPSGVEVAVSSFGTRAISEEINCMLSCERGLGGMSFIVGINVAKYTCRAKTVKILALIDYNR